MHPSGSLLDDLAALPATALSSVGRRAVDWATTSTIDQRVAEARATLTNPATAITMGQRAVRDALARPGTLDMARIGVSAGESAVAPYRSTLVFGTVMAGIVAGAVAVLVYRRATQP